MRHEEFENICNAVKSGKKKIVKHNITDQVGKVTACEAGDFFDVEVGDEHKSWARGNVKEEK